MMLSDRSPCLTDALVAAAPPPLLRWLAVRTFIAFLAPAVIMLQVTHASLVGELMKVHAVQDHPVPVSLDSTHCFGGCSSVPP